MSVEAAIQNLEDFFSNVEAKVAAFFKDETTDMDVLEHMATVISSRFPPDSAVGQDLMQVIAKYLAAAAVPAPACPHDDCVAVPPCPMAGEPVSVGEIPVSELKSAPPTGTPMTDVTPVDADMSAATATLVQE